MRLIFCIFIILVYAAADAQSRPDSLFTDYDLNLLMPVKSTAPETISQKGMYIRKDSKKKSRKGFELIRVYKDSTILKRRASVKNFNYGKVLAFKTLKSPGYEKVLFFADWDYYYDSLLIRSDTLCFKETTSDRVIFSILYKGADDTIKIVRSYRNTRYDFLNKISFSPPLKNYKTLFSDSMFDYTETFTLARRHSFYDLIKIETEGDAPGRMPYEYEGIKDKYAAAGLSLFWLAVADLTY